MPQRNFKMLAVWDTSYVLLDQLRHQQKTTFNNIVSMLIELYQKQVPPQNKQENSVNQAVQALAGMTQPDSTLAQTPVESVAPNDHKQRSI
jgi:hypothetical protein